MSLLNECETECLAAEIESLLSDTATVIREEKTADGRGGTVRIWGIQTTYPCLLTRSLRSADQAFGGSVSNLEEWMLTLPLTSEILVTDRVQIGSAVFEITGDPNLPTTAISRRVRLRRLPNVEPLIV